MKVPPTQVRRAALAGAVALLAALARAEAAPPGDGSFEALRLMPEDATLAVRVRDLRGLRATGSVLPAQAAIMRLADERVLGQSWDALASDLGIPPEELVDRLLGVDAIYGERSAADRSEWVLVARIDQALQDLMVARLAPVVSAGGRSTYPGHQFSAAWRPPYLVAGPADRPALLEEALRRLEASAPQKSLLDDAALAPAASWDPAPVEVAMRHGPGIGGASAVSARPASGSLWLRHRSTFDRPPVHVAPGAAADAGLLRALEQGSVVALAMNPWRGPLDPSEPIDAVLLEGEIDESMRANLGARQAVVVGSAVLDGTRTRVPTFAVALEVRDPLLAERQWDGWARRLAMAATRRAGAAAPPAPSSAPGPRTSGINSALRATFADHPFARDADLHRQSVTGAGGSWQVIASDRALLDRVVAAVGCFVPSPDAGGAHEVGLLDGRALASMLRTWSADPGIFALEGAKAFSQAVGLLADIASAAPEARWRAWCPVPGAIESEASVVLPGPTHQGARPGNDSPQEKGAR